MKLSIITVCKNAQNTLERTLESIIKQTYKNIELIVFDGNSSDNTVGIIERYMHHISFFHSGDDSGIYNAMNKALSKASGDYVLFFNAGDTFCDNEVLERVIEKIKLNNCPDFAFGWARIIYSQGECCRVDKFLNYKRKTFFVNENICHQSIFYKRNLFNNDCYDESFKIYADWDFNARCVRTKGVNMFALDIPVCNFYLGGLSTDANNSKIFRYERDVITRKYFKKIYFIVAFDRFMLKTFKSLYLPLRKIFLK